MLDLQIREQLIKYLASEISLREFQRWFVTATCDLEAVENVSAFKLASDIELLLSEYTSGHLSEEELRSELRQFVEKSTFNLNFGTSASSHHVTSASNSTTRCQSVGIGSVAVLVS